jgi:virginiamycin B lyase
MSPMGAMTETEFSVPAGASPVWIRSGPDGKLRFTEGGGGQIGRVTTTGQIVSYPLTKLGGESAVAVVPDGASWFTEYSIGAIGRITTGG